MSTIVERRQGFIGTPGADTDKRGNSTASTDSQLQTGELVLHGLP